MGAGAVLPWQPLAVLVLLVTVVAPAAVALTVEDSTADNIQPLSTLSMGAARVAMDTASAIHASPAVLGQDGEDSAWVTVNFTAPSPAMDHWIGLFSPADFISSTNPNRAGEDDGPAGLPMAPIKYKFANYTPSFLSSGSGNTSFVVV